ncbi:uncharacterized protein C8Q71DRAFT_716091 [Rhodofomes roseus]|uniref:Uncharacterized protein n=1 Tax=Rhodofomes roseus TaxID=34475 RepID=A0ABQ8K3E0_9APHY|nr:uncharacterized protein C8Q71DRAFT_716091 [Rhodofomes roseus]KAH9830879.1 hypothetical protein C8Q71DRAFT_716091 [Rhodofomes roseus]
MRVPACQNKLPSGVTIAPIILASDKTQLSVFSGDKQAWPVYITIGNIDNETRRQPSKRSTVLLGYLPVTKLLCFEEKDRKAMGYRLFHYAMDILLRPLIDAGENGVKMTCADEQVRDVYPILAAYIADFPEQCLVCCCKQNRCPICKVHPNQRGELLDTVYYRTPPETLSDLANGDNENLSDVKKPFWADLPHANIFRCITPDLLHQLHKGVFKDHLVKWTTEGYTVEIDERFKRVPPYPGLRIFQRGISKVTQWTGNEYRQMQKVFLPILCGVHDDPRVITAARALMDFIFLAHYPAHSSTTLEAMKLALRNFHDNKDVFIDLGVREDFNIPKLHSMNHYVAAIMSLGSCGGLSTEISERLHIDLAKNAYRASNRKQYLKQMVLWLERQDKMAWFGAYLDWAAPVQGPPPTSGPYDDELVFTREDRDAPEDQCLHHPPARAPQLWEPLPYRIAKRPGLGYARPEVLRSEFGAVAFSQALQTFLQSEDRVFESLPLSYLENYDFGLYPLFRRNLPSLNGPTGGRNLFHDIVKAQPPGKAGKAKAAFSTVLFVSKPDQARRLGQILGYRIGQVRAIFDLPPMIAQSRPPSCTPHLAYIELFTEFTPIPERYSRLYKVARAYENRQRVGVVIPLDRIFRSCLLVPDFGPHADLTWSSETVLDEGTGFYLTPFSDHHMYYFVL